MLPPLHHLRDAHTGEAVASATETTASIGPSAEETMEFGQLVLADLPKYGLWPSLLLNDATYSALSGERPVRGATAVFALGEHEAVLTSRGNLRFWPERLVPRIDAKGKYAEAVLEARDYSIAPGREAGRFLLWAQPQYKRASSVCRVIKVLNNDEILVQRDLWNEPQRIRRPSFPECTWIGPTPWWFATPEKLPSETPALLLDDDEFTPGSANRRPYTPPRDVSDDDYRVVDPSRMFARKPKQRDLSQPRMTPEQRAAFERLRAGLNPEMGWGGRSMAGTVKVS